MYGAKIDTKSTRIGGINPTQNHLDHAAVGPHEGEKVYKKDIRP